jgi:hypothetical protein
MDGYPNYIMDDYKKGGKVKGKRKIIKIIRRVKKPTVPRIPKAKPLRRQRVVRVAPLPRYKQVGKGKEEEVKLSMPRQEGAYRYVAPNVASNIPYSEIDKQAINISRKLIADSLPSEYQIALRKPEQKQPEKKEDPINREDELFTQSKQTRQMIQEMRGDITGLRSQFEQFSRVGEGKVKQIENELRGIDQEINQTREDFKNAVDDESKNKIREYQLDLIKQANQKKEELRQRREAEAKKKREAEFNADAIKDMFKGMESMGGSEEPKKKKKPKATPEIIELVDDLYRRIDMIERSDKLKGKKKDKAISDIQEAIYELEQDYDLN